MMTAAATVKDCLQEICNKNKGTLTAEIVLKEAMDEKSPLHSHFVWDDNEAARQYRLLQASDLIRRVKVTYVTQEEIHYKVRAFVNVVPEKANEEGKKVYVEIHEALTTPNYRQQLLSEAKRDADVFVKKYKVLKEVQHIINAIEETKF